MHKKDDMLVTTSFNGDAILYYNKHGALIGTTDEYKYHKHLRVGQLVEIQEWFKYGGKLKDVRGYVDRIMLKKSKDGKKTYAGNPTDNVAGYHIDTIDKVGIFIEGMYNEASSAGVFWLPIDSLLIRNTHNNGYTPFLKTKQKEEVTTMQKKSNYDKAEQMEKDYTVISYTNEWNGDQCLARVYYNGGHIEEGSVICITLNGRHELQKAVDVKAADNQDFVGRELVCILDMAAFTARVDKRYRVAELMDEMDKRVKLLQEQALYAMFADKDAELASMFTEFNQLTNPSSVYALGGNSEKA